MSTAYQPGDVSPCKYPASKGKCRKRKTKEENGGQTKKNKKIKKEPVKGKGQQTLDRWLFKPVKRAKKITFCQHVVVKYCSQKHETFKLIPLLEEDDRRCSLFQLKLREVKEMLKHNHKLRRQQLKPRRICVLNHVLNTLRRVNALNA